jgi:hypothetical protein
VLNFLGIQLHSVLFSAASVVARSIESPLSAYLFPRSS